MRGLRLALTGGLLAGLATLPARLAALGQNGNPPCPTATHGLFSDGDQRATVTFENRAPLDLTLFWLTDKGAERRMGTLRPTERLQQQTFVGHVFRLYALAQPEVLVMEYEVRQSVTVPVEACSQLQAPQGPGREARRRAAEFEALRLEEERACEGRSSRWSCVRPVPEAERQRRPAELYGISQAHADLLGESQGATEDLQHDYQMPLIPHVSGGPGFLVMNMTPHLRELLPWYAERLRDSVQKEHKVEGGYLEGQSDRVNLDMFNKMHKLVTQEMQAVLEWWTQQELRHTSTYGIRVYRKGAVLLNHVDRHDTHVASAVLQVSQRIADGDAGWPLEVFSEEGVCHEVYLQPGEMVLYEGARLKHGRPMRFQGEEFANIFVHFAPRGWRGVQRQSLEL